MANSPSLTTELCRTLGIDYPIFSVGFSMSAGPELAAAVSAAGGFGVLGGGSGGLITPDELRLRISQVRDLTARPFGLNLIIANLGEDPEATAEDKARTLAAIA